jgi:hypothetical protein
MVDSARSVPQNGFRRKAVFFRTKNIRFYYFQLLSKSSRETWTHLLSYANTICDAAVAKIHRYVAPPQ